MSSSKNGKKYPSKGIGKKGRMFIEEKKRANKCGGPQKDVVSLDDLNLKKTSGPPKGEYQKILGTNFHNIGGGSLDKKRTP